MVAGKETSAMSEDAKLQEALRAAQEALRAADQEEVEWKEEDLTDEQLLADLDRLQRGEPDVEAPRTQSSASSQPKLPIQDDEAAMDVDGEAVDEDGMDNVGVSSQDLSSNRSYSNAPTSRQSALKKGSSQDETLKEEPTDDSWQRVSSLLNLRIRQYLDAATSAKKINHPQARALALTYQRLQEVKRRMEEEALLPDLDAIPPVPTLQPMSPASTHKTSSGTSAVADRGEMEIDHVTASAPSPSRAPEVPKLSAEDMRVKRYEQLEGVIMNQLEEMKKAALEANSLNKKVEALAIINKRKLLLKDLELTRMGRMMEGCKVPLFHIDTLEHNRELLNEDLSAHEIEIGLIRVEDVKPASIQDTKLECYITIECPFPDPAKPTLLTTPTVSGGVSGNATSASKAGTKTSLTASSASPNGSSLNPSFNYTQRLRIDRTKGLMRMFQKKKIVFTLWKPKTWFLGSPTFLGKAELKLAALLEASDVHEALDVLDESGHKILGGKVLVSARLRFPLAKRQFIKEVQKVLVIDKHFIGEHQHAMAESQLSASSMPPPDLLTQSTVASLGAVHSSLTESQAGPLEASSADLGQTLSPMLVDGSDTASPTVSSSPVIKNPNGMDYTVPLEPTRANTDVPQNTTSRPTDEGKMGDTNQPAQPTQATTPNQAATTTTQEKSIDFDFNSPAWMISHAVLEWRKDALQKEIAAEKARLAKREKKQEGDENELEALEGMKDDVDHKITVLITLVQTGNLTEEEYARRVKVKIGEEEELFTRLSAVDRLTEASLCKKRIQIMKEEVGIS